MSTATPRATTYAAFSAGRVWALTSNTVTQLLRMRILWFLAVFTIIVVGAAFVFPKFSPEQQLKQLKDWSTGAMAISSFVIAITATALLLPRDIEDRTLYTILCKPVPRYEYLIGKLFGVLVIIGGGLVFMDVILSLVVWLKQNYIIQGMVSGLVDEHSDTPENISAVHGMIDPYGVTASLHAAVFAVFVKAAVISALALLVSCFASSTLFTILITFAATLIGYGEQMAREYFFHAHPSGFGEKAVSLIVSLICPDLNAFDLTEPASRGDVIGVSALLGISGLGALYVTGYTTVAYLFFVEKEL